MFHRVKEHDRVYFWICLDSACFLPNFCLSLKRGGVAQLVEHLLCKQNVCGSIPHTSTISLKFKSNSKV